MTLLGVAAFAFRNVLLGPQVQVQAATVGELRQTVVASGRVITPQRVSVAAEVTGRVSLVAVIEGQRVAPGQLLVELDRRDNLAGEARASAAVAQAQAHLRQVREVGLPAAVQALAQARATALQTRLQLVRVRDLKAQGFVSAAQLDDATRADGIAASQVKAALLQVGTNAATGSDYALALAALAQARADLQLAQSTLAHDRILAPAGGTLIARSVETGNIVQPGKELLALAADGETQVLVQVDEKNLGKLALGQKALGSADAYAGERFEAVVTYINPGIDVIRGSVAVKLSVLAPPAYLRQDMTVSVDIETGRRSGAVAIPAAAVHESAGASPWVMVVRSGHAVRQPVKLGLLGDNRVEVQGGIAAGEEVIVAPLPVVAAGQRVRARAAAAK